MRCDLRDFEGNAIVDGRPVQLLRASERLGRISLTEVFCMQLGGGNGL